VKHRVQASTRRIHEHGQEWINCPGVRIGKGVPRVRREPMTLEDRKRHEMMRYLMQNAYHAQLQGIQLLNPCAYLIPAYFGDAEVISAVTGSLGPGRGNKAVPPVTDRGER